MCRIVNNVCVCGDVRDFGMCICIEFCLFVCMVILELTLSDRNCTLLVVDLSFGVVVLSLYNKCVLM